MRKHLAFILTAALVISMTAGVGNAKAGNVRLEEEQTVEEATAAETETSERSDVETKAAPAKATKAAETAEVGTEAELVAAINGNVSVITLKNNITLSSTIELKAAKTFTIKGNGNTISSSKKVLKVSAGSDVTLENVTITGSPALDVVQGKVTINGTVNLTGGAFNSALTINGGYATPAQVIVNGDLSIKKGTLGKSVDMSGGDNCVLTFNENATVTADKFTPQNGRIVNNSKQVKLNDILTSTANVEIVDNTVPAIVRAYLSASNHRIAVDLARVEFTDSVELKLYSHETLLTTAALNTASVKPGTYPELTGALSLNNSSSSWPRTEWNPSDAYVPTKLELVVDGETVAATEKFYTGSADLGHLMEAQDWYDFPGTACVFDQEGKDDDGTWTECACGEAANKVVHAFLNDTSSLGSHISVNMETVTFEDSVALNVYDAEGSKLTTTNLDVKLVPAGTYGEFTGFIAVGGKDDPWSKDEGWAKHDKVPATVELVVDGEAVSTHKIYNDTTDKFGEVVTPEDWYSFDGTACVFDEWDCTKDEHWKECVCTKIDEATRDEHHFVNDICEVCGAEDKTVAEINGETYFTLADAVKAVKDGETITLTKNVTDAEGISVPGGKNFIVDFNGKTYTVAGPGAGSANTETNCFQLLKGSAITFKNGTINVAEGAESKNVKRIIQNYADLTLEDMTFETANLGRNEDYALSFNNGNITFKGNTNIYTSSAEVIAFDVCQFGSGEYPSVNVTFDESYTGTIEGKIIYDSPNADTHTMTIKGNGSFAAIDASKGNEEIAEKAVEIYGGSFGESVDEYLADGLNAELISKGEEYPYSYYKTVEDALAHAGAGDIVKDLNAADNNEKVFNITLDYGYDNKVVTIQGTSVTLPKLERTGYDFLGWTDGAKDYEAETEVAVEKDTTFTAKWKMVEKEDEQTQGNAGGNKPSDQSGEQEEHVTQTSNIPKTGDQTNISIYLLLAALSAMILAGTSLVRRKR